ncbi:MAG: hypothetical protein A2086_17120 [Spirochaetes bacterium GWD1_27_9]|nr:MAG: hypothetical protein A2Z98_02580 [Spirochaetes bacterium GWB1_27_13]OHD27306.1 MAG: hypothetical protein A2Y34_15905 [Spirochaetes bacterium GWC1_27_15]OHD34168.1 MAG: hypothetical protein A2086_17120 [Spirochaetes bacterium GWD1_27_9]
MQLNIGNHYFQFQGKPNDLTLFLSIGSVIAEIQSFECTMKSFIETILKKSRSIEIGEIFYNKTLVFLIKHFKKKLPDDELSELLEKILENRNFVVHNILKKYQWPIMNDDDYIYGKKRN